MEAGTDVFGQRVRGRSGGSVFFGSSERGVVVASAGRNHGCVCAAGVLDETAAADDSAGADGAAGIVQRDVERGIQSGRDPDGGVCLRASVESRAYHGFFAGDDHGQLRPADRVLQQVWLFQGNHTGAGSGVGGAIVWSDLAGESGAGEGAAEADAERDICVNWGGGSLLFGVAVNG